MAENYHPIMLKVYEASSRMKGSAIVPPSPYPRGVVKSRDVVIDPETGISARLFLPRTALSGMKLPLLVYFHGGGFAKHPAYTQLYHNYLNLLAARVNAVAVSVNYRLRPMRALPVVFDDAWTSLKWVASGQDNWIRDYADLSRVYFGGDSWGGNMTHNVALRAGVENLDGLNLIGIFLNFPYFGGEDPVGGEVSSAARKAITDNIWRIYSPSLRGFDQPWINPAKDENLAKLPCRKVLVHVAELDFLKYRGWFYAETLKKSGWTGEVECVEVAREKHNFNLVTPNCKNSVEMLEKIAAFINDE